MHSCRKRIEQLMDDVMNIIGNKHAAFRVLAKIACERKLTDHEFESMDLQMKLCTSLIRDRFLNYLIRASEESGT